MRAIFQLFFYTIFSLSIFSQIRPGAFQISQILELTKNKRVAIVTNHTAMLGQVHLVDTLLKLGVDIKKIFAPEHGFRGTVDAGAKVNSEVDTKTGLPLTSLYGKNKKPTAKQLLDVDLIIFDIQDVGVRFYTYISTMYYVLQACAENKKTCLILDRPNPNGFYVDGPILEKKYKSFLGIVPIPLVHGCTVGELAQMMVGEKWLDVKIKLDYKVLKVENYTHKDFYHLPIPPSPNLKEMSAIYLYPTLGLFEGTVMSVGRGTNQPFTVLGHPLLKKEVFTFTPEAKLGASRPKYKDTLCYGFNLALIADSIRLQKQINLTYLIKSYEALKDRTTFFDDNFNYHVGNKLLRQAIEGHQTESTMRLAWQKPLLVYKAMRKKYLLYPDFE
jgi:uncharacterized protein YbbC (DUF1343 family)